VSVPEDGEAHLTRTLSHLGDLASSFQEIPRVDGGQESHFAITSEESLISVTADAKLGGHIVDEFQQTGTGNESAAVVSVRFGHTCAKGRLHLFFAHLQLI